MRVSGRQMTWYVVSFKGKITTNINIRKSARSGRTMNEAGDRKIVDLVDTV